MLEALRSQKSQAALALRRVRDTVTVLQGNVPDIVGSHATLDICYSNTKAGAMAASLEERLLELHCFQSSQQVVYCSFKRVP